MTREDIIHMAREAEMYEDGKFFVLEHGELERFAALVAAAEREACAHIAWNMEPDENGPIETAIRARSQQ